MLFCSMCSYSCEDHELFTRHVVRHHRHDANFIVNCCIDDCQYSTKSWNAYKMHVVRRHGELKFEEDEDVDSDDERGNVEVTENAEGICEQKYIDAKFLLALQVDHHVSERGLQTIVSSAQDLVNSHLSLFKKKVENMLREHGHDAEFLNDLFFTDANFELSTKYLHQKFLEDHCGFVRSIPVLMGENLQEIGGNVRRMKAYGYIVPFEKNLEKLLSMPQVWYWLTRSHCSNDGIMRDFCDASFMKDLTINGAANAIYLQIVLYMDEIEIVNPIGSHVKKHKVTMVYFTIANIPPEYRSKYEAIQLLAVVKSHDLKKYGLTKILKDFVETMNRLGGTGIEFSVHNCNVSVKGSLIIVPADTPAAQCLGGFKEGVGFANKVCRTCNTSRTDMKSKFLDDDFQKRSSEQHSERLELMNEMTAIAAKYWSKMWGINSRSPLLDINGVDLAACLVQDPMHILTEGLLSKELCLILYNFITVEKYFKLSFLNTALGGFSFTYLEQKNKPEKISTDDIMSGKLKQTSASLLMLCCILPLVIGKKVPTGNRKWTNFLRMVQITLLSTSPYATEDTAAELEQLIYTHHCDFKNEYPKSPLTPKFHYLVHIPQQILKFGPGRNQWVMRFEGKHLFFKSIQWKCFKNIALSLSMRHQMWMCWRQMGTNGKQAENFLYGGDSTSKLTSSNLELQDLEVKNFLQESDLHQHCIFNATEVEIKGHMYKPGCVLVIDYIDSLPVFGIVNQLLVVSQEKIFVVEHLDIVLFDSHTLYYQVQKSGTKQCFKYSDLKFVFPLSLHMYSGATVVLDKFSIFCESLC